MFPLPIFFVLFSLIATCSLLKLTETEKFNGRRFTAIQRNVHKFNRKLFNNAGAEICIYIIFDVEQPAYYLQVCNINANEFNTACKKEYGSCSSYYDCCQYQSIFFQGQTMICSESSQCVKESGVRKTGLEPGQCWYTYTDEEVNKGYIKSCVLSEADFENKCTALNVLCEQTYDCCQYEALNEANMEVKCVENKCIGVSYETDSVQVNNILPGYNKYYYYFIAVICIAVGLIFILGFRYCLKRYKTNRKLMNIFAKNNTYNSVQ